jgi:protein involved in polysaccharide export with SLBB domain
MEPCGLSPEAPPLLLEGFFHGIHFAKYTPDKFHCTELIAAIMKIFSLLAVIVLITAFFLAGCSPSSEIAKESANQIIRSGSKPVQIEAQSDSYVIRIGDQIQLSVWGYPEFNVSLVVRESGAIPVPLVGDFMAAGFTKEQFTDKLRQKLSEYLQGEIQLNVIVSSTIAQKIAILGEVTHQENYPLTADVSLIEALTTAGGTTAESDLRHIRILRGGLARQMTEVDLTAYIESGNVDAIPMVRPGDTIFVPKRSNVVRELSDFMRDAIFIFGFFRVFN